MRRATNFSDNTSKREKEKRGEEEEKKKVPEKERERRGEGGCIVISQAAIRERECGVPPAS